MKRKLFARGSDTSEAAADSVQEITGKLRLQIYKLIAYYSDVVLHHVGAKPGLTCDEIERLLRLTHQTASARVYELKHLGRITDSGERRKTRSGRGAVVYIVTA